MEQSNKLSPELKFSMADEVTAASDVPLSVLAQIARPLDAEMRDVLENMGAVLRSEAGDVVTLTVPQAAVAAFTQIEWIVYVEASRPLTPDEETPPEPSASDF